MGRNENICEICKLKFALIGHLLEMKERNAGLHLYSGSHREKYLRDL